MIKKYCAKWLEASEGFTWISTGIVRQMLTFEWDDAKNAANILKHGISFELATEIFLDPLSLTIPDPEHSKDEERFVTMGSTLKGLIVVAVHSDRENRIRIISARFATPKEKRNYESA